MTIEERANYGFELKQNGVCNCAMAVLKAFSDKLDIDEMTQKNISSGFSAGMGGMEGTCGAIVGAVIVAGFLSGGVGTPRISRQIVQKFKEKSGATICKDLKAIISGKPRCECPQCVYNGIIALGESMEIKFK
ncbi:MAG: C-GCAxxG-C-C family protein [Bacteroidales bacterium]|nr:C-GCAxxG-C-C family protein [Bacteroidales bacterium]